MIKLPFRIERQTTSFQYDTGYVYEGQGRTGGREATPTEVLLYLILQELTRRNDEDTHVDEHGNVWTRPTAWAYAQACKALQRCKDEGKIAKESK